jgi:hypothetical protein
MMRPLRRAAQKRDEVAPPHWLIPPVLSTKDSTTWVWQGTAALRHFNPANVAVGSRLDRSENVAQCPVSPKADTAGPPA